MFATTHVHCCINGPGPPAVFDVATDLSAVPAYFRGYGLVPNIRRLSMCQGKPGEVGAHRRLEMADGSVLDEEILEFSPPASHAYRVTGFAFPLNFLARFGEGRWTFAATAEGTCIDWHYRFLLTTPAVWPVVWPLVSIMMRGAMQRTLAALAERDWSDR